MKKYYEKYKGKFEILGIDCNDTEEKWKKAVEDNQLPWLHVYNKKDDKDVTKIFGITGYPTKIIIDPEGKIARPSSVRVLRSILIWTSCSSNIS